MHGVLCCVVTIYMFVLTVDEGAKRGLNHALIRYGYANCDGDYMKFVEV